jgi:hypothetical protein
LRGLFSGPREPCHAPTLSGIAKFIVGQEQVALSSHLAMSRNAVFVHIINGDGGC